MNTPAPDSTARSAAANGSTPRVVVTRASLPWGGVGSTATRLFRDPWRPRRMLHLQLLEIKNMKLWRRAVLEAIVTGMWIFAGILIVCESVTWGISLPGRTILVIAFLHSLMFFIYILMAATLSPKEGEMTKLPNLNPAVTLLLMLNGMHGLVGGTLIIIFQCVGSILAALAAKELLPRDRIDLFFLAGCYGRRTFILPNGMEAVFGLSDHKYFLAEFVFSFTFLYTTALLMTRRRLRALGLTVAVLLVSLNIGFNTYLGASIRQGYSGSMFNPAKCLGSAVAYGQPLWDRLWPPFFAPFVAAFAVAFLFGTVPPDHDQAYDEKRDVISKLRVWSRRPGGARRGGDFDEEGSSRLDDDDLELENGTVYEVPSAGRLFSASPDTPDPRQPPEPAQNV